MPVKSSKALRGEDSHPKGQTHVGKSLVFSRLAHGCHESPLTWPQVTPRLHGGVSLPAHNSLLISIRWWDKRPFFAIPLASVCCWLCPDDRASVILSSVSWEPGHEGY